MYIVVGTVLVDRMKLDARLDTSPIEARAGPSFPLGLPLIFPHRISFSSPSFFPPLLLNIYTHTNNGNKFPFPSSSI